MPHLDPTKNYKFSLVIPTRDRSFELKKCLRALGEQSAEGVGLEIIVVNDGGSEDFSDELGALKDKFAIKYFNLEHKGPAASRNFGIKESGGDIIIFIDDDCLPTENWLRTLVQAWNEFTDLDGIGGYVVYDSVDNIYCKANADLFNQCVGHHSSEKGCTFLNTCNSSYKKSMLNEARGFDEQFRDAGGEDRDLNIRILKLGGKLRADKSILVYHAKNSSFSSFVRRHYNYGKAAYKLYDKHSELKHLSTKSYMNFYNSILNKHKSFKDKLVSFLLLAVSQLSTFLGYFFGLFSKLIDTWNFLKRYTINKVK